MEGRAEEIFMREVLCQRVIFESEEERRQGEVGEA